MILGEQTKLYFGLAFSYFHYIQIDKWTRLGGHTVAYILKLMKNCLHRRQNSFMFQQEQFSFTVDFT